MSIKKVEADVFSANLVLPPPNQPNQGDTYDVADKFFYKDTTLRPLVDNAVTLEKTFIYDAIYSVNPVYQLDDQTFIGITLQSFDAFIPIIEQQNKYFQNDLRFPLLKNLPKKVDFSNYGPPVYNQGNIGSCYANSVSTMLGYGYAKKLMEQYKDANLVKQTISTLLPSRVYLEYTMQKFFSLYKNKNPFDQGGLPDILTLSLQFIEGLPLEVNYTYPELNEFSSTQFNAFDEKTQIYLKEEWTKKKIDSPDVFIKDINKATPFYNNIKAIMCIFKDEKYKINQFPSPNNLWSLAQKKNKKGCLLWYDDNGNITTKNTGLGVPKYCACDRVKLYKSILAKNNAISLLFPIYSNWFDIRPLNTNILIPSPSATLKGGHIITWVGYDDCHPNPDGSFGAFKVQNSWGTNVGENGFFWMSYKWINYFLSYDSLKLNNKSGGSYCLSTFTSCDVPLQ